MKILEILVFLSSLFSLANSDKQNVCPASFCGRVSIEYPFKLQTSQPQNDCTYTSLSCNESTAGAPVLNLPYGGEFYVTFIDYYQPYIQLSDPGNCLMSRLMNNLNLSSSPFKAIRYENYTFYMCPSTLDFIGRGITPIACLSNSTNSTVAAAGVIEFDLMFGSGCEVVGSRILPVFDSQQFQFDGDDVHLFLTWNSTCITCEEAGNQADTGESSNSWATFAASPYFIPSSVAISIFFVISLLKIIRVAQRGNERGSDSLPTNVQPISVTAPPQSTAEGLDESKINACTELAVHSESRKNPGMESSTCSICLEIYLPQDIVRSIAKCEHCFHADCIELWLRKNRTCPVCRTILADDDIEL